MQHSFYTNKRVFVTGGAGFIGSALTNKLIDLGAIVTIGDNLSSGSLVNVKRVWTRQDLSYKKTSTGLLTNTKHSFVHIDFQDFSQTKNVLKNQEIVFHLAANIGGRGYIATHLADCCEGFSVNQNVMKASHEVGVDRVIFASSACVYPIDLQKSYASKYLLKESDALQKGWGNADETYGWAKLMGEEMLRAYHTQYGLKGASTRYVTAYGPWENDTHAIIALIKRAVEHQDPYTIWGSGKQDRDFTFVEDIVSGTLLVGEKVTDGSAINLGTGKRYTMLELTQLIFNILNWHPNKIVFDRSKPEGVKTRALSNAHAKKLGWKPTHTLQQGLEKTISWYLEHTPKSVETL